MGYAEAFGPELRHRCAGDAQERLVASIGGTDRRDVSAPPERRADISRRFMD